MLLKNVSMNFDETLSKGKFNKHFSENINFIFQNYKTISHVQSIKKLLITAEKSYAI